MCRYNVIPIFPACHRVNGQDHFLDEYDNPPAHNFILGYIAIEWATAQ